MTNLSRFQFNALLRAGVVAGVVAATFGSLGRVGGNLNPSAQYNQSAIFFNAVFDGRRFDAPSGPTPLDANGWPTTGGWQQVICASVNATNTTDQPHLKSGQLTLARYDNCLFKTPSATPCVLSCAGGSITGVTLQSDDGTTKTYTYSLLPTPDGNVVISGTQPISFMYVPWDGSTAYNVLSPLFNSRPLAYYAQFATHRLMDFCSTLDTNSGLSGIGKLGEKTWSDPVTGRVPNRSMLSPAYSWETIFAFVKAVDAYSGGATKLWINLPPFSDADYASNLATLAASMGVPEVYVEYGNEPWNPGYYFLNEYLYYGRQECQVVADYGTGTTVVGISGTNPSAQVTSVTSDASRNVTVTLNVPVSNYPQIVAGTIFGINGLTIGNGSNTTAWNAPSGTVIASTTTNSFTYPTTTAPISSSLSNVVYLSMVVVEPIKISSVTSDGAGNVTVTLSTPLTYYPFSIAAGVKMVANCQAISAWNAGTLASPVTVSATTTNSFTYPCATAPASSTLAAGKSFSCWIGQVASSGVGLDSDLIKGSNDFNVFDLSAYYYTRQLKRSSDAWYAVRPGDKFILGLQTYGQVNPGNQFAPPHHFSYGTWLGNQSGTRPNLTWIYGAATAPYNSAGTLTTADAAFATFTANLTNIGYKIDSHVYYCRINGLVPMAYEWGPDTSSTSALQIDINADPRMRSMVKALGDRILQAGFQVTNYFMVTPGAYQQTNVGSGWPSQQTFTDTFTNFKTLGLLDLMAETENYATANGTCPCTFLGVNSKMSTGDTLNVANTTFPGIYYWGSSGTRDKSWLGASNSAGTFTCTVTGTDSAAGTQMTIYVDGVLQGAVTLPQGGAGNSAGSTPSASTTLSVTVPKGPFVLKAAILSGGTSPGMTEIDFV